MTEQNQLRLMGSEDLFQLEFVAAADLSLDGQQVAYAVISTDTTEDKDHSAIWLLAVETGESRQLTTGLAKDTAPAWSPDGKVIAFISTRDEQAQIYIIPVDGGEARALTNLEQGVGGDPVWSPDGKFIAFTAGPQGRDRNPSEPYRITRDMYRFDAMGYLDDVVQDIYVVSAEGGEAKQLTGDAFHNSAPVWAPDGQEILFLASLYPDWYHASHPIAKIVNLEGEIRDLASDWGFVDQAAWTQDGKRIVFVGSPHGRQHGSKRDVWVIELGGGKTQQSPPECRTADLQFGSGGTVISDTPGRNIQPKLLITEDGASAIVPVHVGGTFHLYRVALGGPESWAPVVDGERTCTPLGLNGGNLLFVAGTSQVPNELFVASTEGEDQRQLTRLNQAFLAGIKLPEVEHLLFTGVDGIRVEGWIMKPPVGEPPYPTVLHIHGGPHASYGHTYYFEYQMLAGAGYAVLFINQRGSTGYGDAFANQIVGDWGNLDYQDLMAGVDFAIEKGIADPDRLGCTGLSGGGYLTCWIVGQIDRFKAAVTENPVTNWHSFYGVSDLGPWFSVAMLGGHPHEIPEVYARCSPITYAHRCKTPTLVIQHERDYRCPPEQSEQFYTVLKANGCPVEMLRIPDSPHAGHADGPPLVRRTQNEALLDWMNRYVQGRGTGV